MKLWTFATGTSVQHSLHFSRCSWLIYCLTDWRHYRVAIIWNQHRTADCSDIILWSLVSWCCFQLHLFYTLCLKKTHQVWNDDIGRNYKDRFWWHLAEFKRLYNGVCMFKFSTYFCFISFSSFKPDTENNANFDSVSSKCANFDKMQFF